MKKGKYTLNKDARFIVGSGSFGLRKGRTVEVTQIDKEYGKVLVSYGDRLSDWVSWSKFERLFSEID